MRRRPATTTVNFFGHATLAAAEDDDPSFVLGAMLPDLAAMAGLRVASADDPALRRGLDHHHRVDAAFHVTGAFLELQEQARRELRADGLGRWSANAVAHVGLELLLDGWLLARDGSPPAYARALAAAPALGEGVRWRRAEGARSWRALCARLDGAPIPEGYRDPDFVAGAVERLLRRRPRLALADDGPAAVRAWARRAAPAVGSRAPGLLAELDARLAPP